MRLLCWQSVRRQKELAFDTTVWIHWGMHRRSYPTLDEINCMNRAQLIDAFKSAQIGCIPRNASQNFLRGNLAWAAQAAAHGHDPVALRASLVSKADKPGGRKHPRYKPGTRLIREWHGVMHEVTVEEKGYTWNGTHYRSLSRIAQEITGTRWSGPRFFGLGGATP
jgi:hypothetical protein